ERQAERMLTLARGRSPDLVVANARPLTFWKREMLWRDGTEFGSGDYGLGQGTRFGAARRNLYGSVDLTPLVRDDPDARAFLFWSRMPVVEPSGATLRVWDQRFADPIGSDRFALVLRVDRLPVAQ